MSEIVKVDLIRSDAGDCITVNEYRICGRKPVNGKVEKSWTTDKEDVLRAFLTPDERHAWLGKQLRVVLAETTEAVQVSLTLAQKREIATQVILAEVGKGFTIDEAVARIQKGKHREQVSSY